MICITGLEPQRKFPQAAAHQQLRKLEAILGKHYEGISTALSASLLCAFCIGVWAPAASRNLPRALRCDLDRSTGIMVLPHTLEYACPGDAAFFNFWQMSSCPLAVHGIF